MEEKRYLVYEATVKLIKSPVFILAAVCYIALSVINTVSAVSIFDIDEKLTSVVTIASVIPSLVLSVGFILLLIAVFSDSYSPFSTGITFIRVFAILGVIITIVPTFLGLIFRTSEMSGYTNNGVILPDSYEIGYYVGLLIPTVLYTVFYLKIFKFADTVRYSAESDIPHPEEGSFIVACMIAVTVIILPSLLGIFTILSSSSSLSVAVIMKVIIYILFAILIVMYRNRMKGVAEIQSELKREQE